MKISVTPTPRFQRHAGPFRADNLFCSNDIELVSHCRKNCVTRSLAGSRRRILVPILVTLLSATMHESRL
jgi:hypothetical protein